MSRNRNMAAGAGVLALGALVAITPRYLFPVCEYFGVTMQLPSGKTEHMHCFYTGRAALMAGVLIGLVGVALFLARRPETVRLLSLVLGGAAAGVMLIPAVLFPICENPDMHCNQGTMPLLMVLGIGTFLTSAWLGTTSRSAKLAYSGSAPETA